MVLSKIVLATGNQKKINEIKAILHDVPVEWHTLSEFAPIPEVDEDGKTFAENALKKARSAYQFTKIAALGDDSGLEIDALGGRPGLFSARYAGEHHNDKKNNARVLMELAGVPDKKRTARFRCVLALVGPDESGKYAEILFDGACEGLIIQEARGTGGFGYDPIFLVPEYGKTFAELEPEIKNKMSHRGRALEQFKRWMIHEK